MTTPPDARNALAEIVAGLDGVTPGPWLVREYSHRPSGAGSGLRMVWDTDRRNMCLECVPAPVAHHIARCNPATIRSIADYVAALEAQVEGMRAALGTPFCVVFLDGRNEHGSHVLASYPRSFEIVDDDVSEQAEAILEAAENAGFQIGQHVWAEFDWIAPQIGDEGRVELTGYWEFRWINEEMTRAALSAEVEG